MDYIDIHCHVNFSEYDEDREGVIKRAQDAGVGMIVVGTGIEMSKRAVEISEKYKNIWSTVAIHPNHAKDEEDFLIIKDLAKSSKVVGIGECGLDYFHSEKGELDKQRELFIKHINLANELNKPLMLHLRNGKDFSLAYEEAVLILKKHSKVKANFHFFAGSLEDLKKILDIGATVSFTGVISFTKDYNELVKYTPKDRIMSETDAPYVSPVPYRGKRNEPVYVIEVAKAMKSIKGEGFEEKQLVDNARNMFGI